jgi:hypothetical protein
MRNPMAGKLLLRHDLIDIYFCFFFLLFFSPSHHVFLSASVVSILGLMLRLQTDLIFSVEVCEPSFVVF